MTIAALGRNHPLRERLSAEMHLRRLPVIAAPTRILQLVTIVGDEDRAEIRRWLSALGFDRNVEAHFFRGRLCGLDFAWERHTEFCTWTLIAPASAGDTYFGLRCFEQAAPHMDTIPGKIIRGSNISLIAEDDPHLLSADFAPDDLVSCDIANGRARIWSDFRLHSDGLGRLLIADRGLGPAETPHLIQRLQELGNYRKMALLGLAVVREQQAKLGALEGRLAALVPSIANPLSDDRNMLASLSDLSADLAQIEIDTDYRLHATSAYAALVNDRLASLSIVPREGHVSLADFTERRLLPAVRTCGAFHARRQRLAQSASWASSLLRTRVEIGLAQQNQHLLRSMDRRAALQLRLQQTVEGLSVFAITYYALGLFSWPVKLLHHFMPLIVEPLIMSLLLPALLAFGWFKVRSARHTATADPP